MKKRTTVGRYKAVSLEKSDGVTYTPKIFADFVARRIVEFARPVPGDRPIRVLDPALGRGELLVSLLEHLSENDYVIEASGFDTDPSHLDVATSRLSGRFANVRLNFTLGNFLDFASEHFNPTDNEELFGRPNRNKFDLIIANPPYVRTQVLGAARARSLALRFALKGRIDIYHAFLVAISRVLAREGTVGVIVSNRFMTTKSGSHVRKDIIRHLDIREIWDLGDTKLFDAAVLPAVLVAHGGSGRYSSTPQFTSIYETNRSAHWVARDPIGALAHEGVVEVEDGRRFRVRRGTLNIDETSPSNVWRVSSDGIDEWLATVEKNTWATFRKLGKIRVGVKTCADRVFIRDDWHAMSALRRPELLRPLTTHRVARRFKPDTAGTAVHIVYPHEVIHGRRRAIDLTKYPKTKAYLDAHRTSLANRRYVTNAGRRWYEIWVPQDPDAWIHPKLVFRDISAEPTFWLDFDGTVVNGDCYWLTPQNPEQTDLLWLAAAVGNSTFIERYYDRRFHNKLYGGRRRFITQYVQQFPLPDPASSLGKTIIDRAKQVYERIPSMDVQSLVEELDTMVWASFGLSTEEIGG